VPGKTLMNQGWKDSGNGIVDADGAVARSPIALIEVQGYVYRAKLGIGDLFERAGDPERGRGLRQQAADLRERFNRDFWLESLGTFALALQGKNEPCAVVSSNPGQALWSGIADPDKARRTCERLMAEDMFSGWGIRTLSSAQRGYNPVGYHLGTVWPHDNSIIAEGFRRYGFDEAATRVFDGIVDAATHFDSYRLPELFAGYSKEAYGVPVRYPVACHPQAWAAGSVPYMLQSLFGLVPEAFERRLRISRPRLPDFADRMRLSGVRVGDARVDLAFERSAGGVAVQVPRVEGDLEVIVQPGVGRR
jgi:glycogen debranching enzyme